MWRDKRIFSLAAASDELNYLSATADGVLALDTGDSGAELCSVTVTGKCAYEKKSGVGYYVGDVAYLDVRVHGDCFMDGEELVRLMKKCSSRSYGGEYDSEHFIYKASDDSSYAVVSSNHALIGRSAVEAEMTVLLEDDIKSGGALVPGLHFSHKYGTSTAISSETSGVGEVKLTGKSSAAQLCLGLIHKAVESEMTLPVKYSSVVIRRIGSDATEYTGENLSFPIGTPLLYMLTNDGDIFDELECVSGAITRRLGKRTLSAGEAFTEVVYQGYTCYRLDLGEEIGYPYVSIDGVDCVASADDFSFADIGVLVAPDMKSLYFSADAYTDPLDMITGAIAGKEMIYALKNEVVKTLGVSINPETGEKKLYIEACSDAFPEIEVKYKPKE